MAVKILGTGSYLPPRTVSNDDLAKSLDTSDEWIYSHTGIHSRHIAGADDSTSSMAVKAARQAIERAGVSPDEIGTVIVATTTPDYLAFPSTACIVQDALGCKNAGAFDLMAACSGFIYALETARGLVAVNPDRKVLVIGSETLSRIVDWNDRTTCILFGDGAGAAVVGACDGEDSWITRLGSDGSGARFIIREGGTRLDPQSEEAKSLGSQLKMNGRQVFNFAVKTLDEVVRGLCSRAGIKVADLDRVFAHQANGRIIEAVARRMELPLSKFYLNIHETGNTSAASIPVALDQAVREGELKPGMRIALVGFGAGLTYGGTLMTWR